MALTRIQTLQALFYPPLILAYFLRKLPVKYAFSLRMDMDAVVRPNYAYCMWQAAREAKRLGISKISAIEFGVASGEGLIAIEQLAEQITRLTTIQFDIYGFDLGEGLPSPKDYRDMPYIWQKGFYKMNPKDLKKKLKFSTTLLLGDVFNTVPTFMRKTIAPIGFVSFDLDFYSSTANALKLFNASNNKLLPRVYCYFDDIIGYDEEIYNQYSGELLAINEFNKAHLNKKLDVIHGLNHKRPIKAYWWDTIYVLHSFKHKKYNQYIYKNRNRQ